MSAEENLQNSITELGKSLEKLLTSYTLLRKELDLILIELEDRYDGASDSPTLWMGSYIRDIKYALERRY